MKNRRFFDEFNVQNKKAEVINAFKDTERIIQDVIKEDVE